MTEARPTIITLQDGRVVACYPGGRYVAMGSCWWIGAYHWCRGGEITIAGGWDEHDAGVVTCDESN